MSSPHKMDQKDVYGTFLLDGSEFAIKAEYVREVINCPHLFNKLPQAPNYLIGIFNFRGIAVPVINLSELFGFCDNNNMKEQKVVVIEHGPYCFGLLFDSTGEVFNSKSVDRNDFDSNSEEKKQNVIKGIFKLGREKRVVQILDPYEILMLDKVPNSRHENLRRNKKGKKLHAITFSVGPNSYAFEINSMSEIVPVDKIETNAFSSELCIGSIRVRGEAIPIMNTHFLLGVEPKEDDPEKQQSKAIILEVDEIKTAFLVDSLGTIESYYQEDFLEVPNSLGGQERLVKGCISDESGENIKSILLDHNSITNKEGIKMISKGHSSLMNSEFKAKSLEKIKLRTFITFDVIQEFALEMGEIVEILDCPKAISKTPDMSSAVCGMISVRGELIGLVDTPFLLGEKSYEQAMVSKKAIIVQDGETKYALLVDSINEIITVKGSTEVKLPQSIFRGESRLNLIKEAVEFEMQTGGKKTLLRLSIDAILNCVRNNSENKIA